MLNILQKKKYVKEYKPINYERINFLNFFKNSGYVEKILCLYKDSNEGDSVYYSYRSRTDVVCTDKEIFIICDHNKDNNVFAYTLVQTDFSVPIKFKIIMVVDSEECKLNGSDPKTKIYEYIRENKYVSIKNKENKRPQIDFGYGSIIIEIIEGLKEILKVKQEYTEDELLNLILENVEISNMYKKEVESLEDERTAYKRVKSRAMPYLDIIFCGCNNDRITIQEAFNMGKKYQENYYYNV